MTKRLERVLTWMGVAALLTTLGFEVGCADKKLPPLSNTADGQSLEDYRTSFKDNPEMFPRELSMPAREELLTINWAMKKSVEDGNLKVRLMAPPLQLTGDPNLDRSSTYEAQVVADDVPEGQSFLDVYEIRISPKPELYVVRPARTAASLQAGDLLMAEEEIARLGLDASSLRADSIFATNLLPVLTNRLAAAQTNATKALTVISNTLLTLDASLITTQTNLLGITNQIATLLGTNKVDQLTAKDLASYLPLQSSNQALLNAQSNLQDQKSNQQKQQAALTLDLSRTEAQLAAARDHGDLAAAMLPAITNLQNFWTDWSKNRLYQSDYSTNGPALTNRTAVSIMFRPQAVASLSQVTIDVRKRARTLLEKLQQEKPALLEQRTNLYNTLQAIVTNLISIQTNLMANSNLMTTAKKTMKATPDWAQRYEDALMTNEVLLAHQASEQALAVRTRDGLAAIQTNNATLVGNLNAEIGRYETNLALLAYQLQSNSNQMREAAIVLAGRTAQETLYSNTVSTNASLIAELGQRRGLQLKAQADLADFRIKQFDALEQLRDNLQSCKTKLAALTNKITANSNQISEIQATLAEVSRQAEDHADALGANELLLADQARKQELLAQASANLVSARTNGSNDLTMASQKVYECRTNLAAVVVSLAANSNRLSAAVEAKATAQRQSARLEASLRLNADLLADLGARQGEQQDAEARLQRAPARYQRELSAREQNLADLAQQVNDLGERVLANNGVMSKAKAALADILARGRDYTNALGTNQLLLQRQAAYRDRQAAADVTLASERASLAKRMAELTAELDNYATNLSVWAGKLAANSNALNSAEQARKFDQATNSVYAECLARHFVLTNLYARMSKESDMASNQLAKCEQQVSDLEHGIDDCVRTNKIDTASEPEKSWTSQTNIAAQAISDMGRTASKIERVAATLSGLLIYTEPEIDQENRRAHIWALARQLDIFGEELKATRSLLDETVTNIQTNAFLAYIKTNTSEPYHDQAWFQTYKAWTYAVQTGVGRMIDDLSLTVDGLSKARVGQVELRHSVTNLQARLLAIRKGARACSVLMAGHPPYPGQRFASWRSRGIDNDFVKRILNGEQAVFQVPVLHGVVTTTAFLLADDGASQMFGRQFADQFYAAQVTFRNPNDRPILLYGNTMRLVVRMNASLPGGVSEDGQLLRDKWWATFEPLDYDGIRRMVEGLQEGTWQRWLSKALDLAMMAGGGWVGVGAPAGFTSAFGIVSALSPKLRDMIEADLKRNALNFREKGLNSIEEIAAQGVLTRYVFLPKGPIYGTYAYDEAVANDLPFASDSSWLPHWMPFTAKSTDFGRRALQPAYIFDIRREDVYVQGKRILASDSLSSGTQ